MDSPATAPPSPKVEANDKLLKALITILALKDPHLLDELRTVFAYAGEVGNEVGTADPATWNHIRKELGLIAELVETEPALPPAH